jgi:hypothetical protein
MSGEPGSAYMGMSPEKSMVGFPADDADWRRYSLLGERVGFECESISVRYCE